MRACVRAVLYTHTHTRTRAYPTTDGRAALSRGGTVIHTVRRAHSRSPEWKAVARVLVRSRTFAPPPTWSSSTTPCAPAFKSSLSPLALFAVPGRSCRFTKNHADRCASPTPAVSRHVLPVRPTSRRPSTAKVLTRIPPTLPIAVGSLIFLSARNPPPRPVRRRNDALQSPPLLLS